MKVRGCLITACKMAKAPKKAHIGSIYLHFDMQKEIAEQMGWDCLFDPDGSPTNGWDMLPLSGEVALNNIKFKGNKRPSPTHDMLANLIGNFQAHRTKGKGETGTSFYLSAIVKSTDPDFTNVIPFWLGLGDSACVLTLKEKQMSFADVTASDDDSEKDDAGPESEDPDDQQSLASVHEMKRRGNK